MRPNQRLINDAAFRRQLMAQSLDEHEFAVGASRGGRYSQRYQRNGLKVGQGGSGALRSNKDKGHCDENWGDEENGGGHGRINCKATPPRCDCHVIGANTTGTAGIASNATGTLTIDSGDATSFTPYYIAILVLQTSATDVDLVANAAPLLGLLMDSTSGREPNMRRASATDFAFGVWTLIFGDEKEIECVDWRKFASTNNQQLTMTFGNPNTVAVHVFVNLWGLAAA